MTAVRALLCSAVLLSCGLTVSAVAGDEKPATQPATAAAVELQPGTWKDITAGRCVVHILCSVHAGISRAGQAAQIVS
jgi:hypothetical protein